MGSGEEVSVLTRDVYHREAVVTPGTGSVSGTELLPEPRPPWRLLYTRGEVKPG